MSPWHDIPLYLKGPQQGLVSFVCEIPKETRAKMEVATVSSILMYELKRGNFFGRILRRADATIKALKLRTCVGRGADAHQAGRQERQATHLPMEHPLELRHAARDLGGPDACIGSCRRLPGCVSSAFLNAACSCPGARLST